MTYDNPLVPYRADPWVYKHIDGYYYFTGSVPSFDSIELRRAKGLNDLKKSEAVTIWRAPQKGLMSQLIWAPELHYFKDKWYLYFAASDSLTERNQQHYHRMFVLENSHPNPLMGEWVGKGQLLTPQKSFSLDGTSFTHLGELYYVWAQKEPAIPGNSNLYVSKMANPWTLKGIPTLISIPEYEWEVQGHAVNEGPAVLKRNGKIFITYSASATDENYAMGLLWASDKADLLDGYMWHKLSEPVFVSSEKNQQFGPGHNSFTISEDGVEDILIYHSRPQKNSLTNPLNNPDRHARAQVFNWNCEGFPIFGEPVADHE